MRPIHYLIFSVALILGSNSFSFADEDYCEAGDGSCSQNNQCCQCQNQSCDKVNLRYKYRVRYPCGCYPYYTREHGVDREAWWANKKYEPFHYWLAR